MAISVLIVEDDRNIAELLQLYLEKEGYAVTLDGLADTSPESALCFRPLRPRLESGLDLIWKKYQVFSPAAELFLARLREMLGGAVYDQV